MKLKDIQLSDSLEGLARVGVAFFKGILNGAVSSELRKRMDALADELRRTIGDRPLSELDVVQRNRRLYHSLGVDPTKDRPSSERLLRRVMKRSPLPKVNKLVDAVNMASLALQCPLGVYDWDKIAPPVLVRIGKPQDSYLSVSNRPVNLEGHLVLVDGEGLFGNPSHNSRRTRISFGTVRALLVAWAPADAPRDRLESVLKEVIQLVGEFCEGTVAEWGILS